MKSGSRDKAEGFVDKLAGRVLETFPKLTGRPSVGAKGKAARARGSARSAKGRATKRGPEVRARVVYLPGEGRLFAVRVIRAYAARAASQASSTEPAVAGTSPGSAGEEWAGKAPTPVRGTGWRPHAPELASGMGRSSRTLLPKAAATFRATPRGLPEVFERYRAGQQSSEVWYRSAPRRPGRLARTSLVIDGAKRYVATRQSTDRNPRRSPYGHGHRRREQAE